MAEQKSKKPENKSPAGGNFNPGGQAGKRAQEQEGRQHSPNNANPGQTGTPGGKRQAGRPAKPEALNAKFIKPGTANSPLSLRVAFSSK